VKEGRLLGLSERWFRALLRFYPRDFREEMGDALVEAYRDQARASLRRGGTISLLGVWMKALSDSVRNGPGERVRPAAPWRRSGNWGRDTELAVRRLIRAPLFAVAMVGTLTVGLGAFAVVYAAVHKILIEPLPYEAPEDLYYVWRDYTWFQFGRGWAGPTDVAELQQTGGVIADAAGLLSVPMLVARTVDEEPWEIPTVSTSPNLFGLLGVQPILGRGFAADEVGPGRTPVVVLTHGLWQRLGGDPGIIGTDIIMNRNPWTVIGVMGPDFTFVRNASIGAPQPADAFITLNHHLAEGSPTNGSYAALIRARPGTAEEAVAATVGAVGAVVDERDFGGRGLRLYPTSLQPDLVGPVRPALVVLGLAGVFLVLVLLVNLATLLLTRAMHREQEFAVSRALGANRLALVRATVLEAGLLGTLGGATAAFAAVWGTRVLVSLAPLDLPRRENIAVDWGVAVVVIGVGAVVGLLAGAAPAIWASRTRLSTLLGSTRVRGGGARGRLRRSMVVVQVALSLVLLSAGGLVVRSFERLLRTDPGFDSAGVLTLRIPLLQAMAPDQDAINALHERLHQELAALPGVTAVGAVSGIPLSGGANQTAVVFPGAPGNLGDEDHDRPLIDWLRVRPGFFEALAVPVLAGRTFQGAANVEVLETVIDRTLAQKFFPAANPIGATMTLGETDVTIIGVVDHVHFTDVGQEGLGQVYIRNEIATIGTLSWLLRTGRSPSSLVPDVRAAVRRVDPQLALVDIQTMDRIVADALRQERLTAVLIAGFSLGALLLAGMGLFAVVSGSVTRRRHELAVRLALGAEHGGVLRLVMQEGVLLVLLGLAIGVPGVYLAGRAMQGVLYGVSPSDPLTLAAVAGILGLVAMAACYLPARRVLRIEPGRSLRQE
jgi:putative ABC transport system permease protein